nr:MAG: hypothetical protein J07AB56_13920 [Candidatus Nanosalinarum sp. J07AB56]
MFSETLDELVSGDVARRTVAGWILAFSAFFVLPAPFAAGYLYRSMRTDGLPGFGDLFGMYVDGLRLLLVSVSVFLPGFGVIAAAETLGSGVLSVVGFLLVPAGFYVMYAAIYLASNGGLLSVLSRRLLDISLDTSYAVAVFGGLLLASAASVVYALSFILLVPVLLLPAFNFYQQLFVHRLVKNAIEE